MKLDLAHFFGSKKKSDAKKAAEQPLGAGQHAEAADNQEQTSAPAAVQAPNLKPSNTLPQEHNWIENEDLLRDEGILAGIAGARPERWLEMIDAHYQTRIDVAKAKSDTQYDRIAEAAKRLEDIRTRRTEAEKNVEELNVPQLQKASKLPRLLVGLVAYTAMAVLCFFPVKIWYKTLDSDHFLAAIGVYVLGLLSLFAAKGYFYRADRSEDDNKQPETWKMLFEQFGIPMAAAFFLTLWGWNGQVGYALSLFMLMLFVFIFTGKAFLSYLVEIPTEITRNRHRAAEMRFRQQKAAALQTKVNDLQTSEAFWEDKLMQFRTEASPVHELLKRLEGQKIRALRLFEVEYTLATEARKKLTDNQLSELNFLKVKNLE